MQSESTGDPSRAAFVSVSMSQAGVELPGATVEQRTVHAANVRQILETFFRQTGWRQPYARYNFAMKFVVKRIAEKLGRSTTDSPTGRHSIASPTNLEPR